MKIQITKYASGDFNTPTLPGQMFKSKEELIAAVKTAAGFFTNEPYVRKNSWDKPGTQELGRLPGMNPTLNPTNAPKDSPTAYTGQVANLLNEALKLLRHVDPNAEAVGSLLRTINQLHGEGKAPPVVPHPTMPSKLTRNPEEAKPSAEFERRNWADLDTIRKEPARREHPDPQFDERGRYKTDQHWSADLH
jgi:hypothetical protein